MQIALFAVCNLPETDLLVSPAAVSNYRLAFTGNNFQAFLIGRQICVTMSMFLLARITTTDVDTSAPIPVEDVLDMPCPLQNFFNTGLPGALITTIVASLMWRIVASTFPVAFLGNPFVLPTIQICLALEYSGVFSASWLCADAFKSVTGLKDDESYLGGEIGGGHKPQMSYDNESLRTVSSSSSEESGSLRTLSPSSSEEEDAY